MLHDKATTSQPLGRCFDSRGAGGGGSGSRALRSRFWQPSAPRSSATPGWRPTPGPSEPLAGAVGGRAGSGFRLPRPMWRPGSVSDRGREPAANRSVWEASAVCKVFCWRGFSVCFFHSSATLERKSEKLDRREDLPCSPPDLCPAPPVSLLSRKGTL